MGSRFYLTTAIDYPNSRPHIGTAFEKIGADVQARYRRMHGHNVFFLMGNDENTIKVAKRASELGREPKEYCDDMARQFKEVWNALDISYDDFIQTSEPRHHEGCRKFIQKVYDNGYIYKGIYEGLYCEGCEAFKTEKEIKESNGVCKDHGVSPIKRSEPCYFFALSKFQDKLLDFYKHNPKFVQPEARFNEVMNLIQSGLHDINITRTGQTWGIRAPFDEDFTIYVWFDALLNYITAIGYGQDEWRFRTWWPADIHFIGKDITRFHCTLWPAMLMAAGLEVPRVVFGHGFVYRKESGELQKFSKTLGNVIEPMEIITKFSAEAFRYYFMRECPFPNGGEFSWQRFADVYDSELASRLGNVYSRVVTLIVSKFGGCLSDTSNAEISCTKEIVQQIRDHIEACQYNQALQKIWQQVIVPTDQYLEKNKPWSLVKTDPELAKHVLYHAVEQLRSIAILIKPFLPRSAETIYRSFNFQQSWEDVRYEDVWENPLTTAKKAVSYVCELYLPLVATENLRFLGELDHGKVKPLFPKIA